MALISKIKEIKPNYIIHHFKRHYFQIPALRLLNQTPLQRSFNNQFLPNSPKFRPNFQLFDDFFISRVRFYAAPVQIKKEVVTPSRQRLNDEITADVIRLVIDDEQHTVISRHEALSRAKNLKLDLVEVDRNAKPPVCKIMDFNREKYKKQVKEKERAKTKSAGSLKGGACKEVRISAKTELKDLKMKADSVRRLIERGYRVKCSATGSEDQDLIGLLNKVSALIEDVVFVESGPTMGRDQAFLIARHIKFGPPRKGGKKASTGKTVATPEVHNAATTTTPEVHNAVTAANDSTIEEEEDYEEPGRDSDDDVEAPLHGQKESPWSATSVSPADQNIGKVFDLRPDLSGSSSSQDKQKFGREAEPSTTYNNASRFPPKTPIFTATNGRPISQENENRYARGAANNTSDVRNPMRRFPTDGTPPQTQPQRNTPPRVPQKGGEEDTPPRNFRLPSYEIPQPRGEFQNQSNQPSSNFSGSIRHRQSPSNVNNVRTRPPGFGSSSGTKLDGSNPSSPLPSDATRFPGPGKVPGNSNSSTLKSDAPETSKPTEKKFGIFSK